MMGKTPITITISRQMGSGGSFIGYSVAKELGFNYIDREILRQAAERLGTDPGALEYLDERSPGLDREAHQRIFFRHAGNFRPPSPETIGGS